MHRILSRSPVRFLIVGALCATGHNVIVIGGSVIGINYVYSTIVSYFVVVTIGFLLHANFTFSQQATGGSFVRYAVAMAANYPVSILLMFIFVNILHLVVAIASPLSTVILIVWNYTVSRWAILEKARATRGIQNDRG